MSVFVVQHHFAKKEHFDFRLEMDGVLKSWAVPKEPPKVKGVKRLAIHVEDHALDYANFEGDIPKGMYGAGRVEIWDKGDYNLIDRKDYKLVFELFGKKLKGKYVLLRFKPKSEKDDTWLLFKK